jgi:glycerol-3-phosphate cytidylyltransferase
VSEKIGFTQGVFDMFHIGHLNLLKNARKYCDYLIVGVNSDELVKKYKNKSPIIPFNERIAIVDSIRYVDETIKVDTLDKVVTWNLKQYNLLLIGDDWKGSQRWIQTEKIMAAYGVKVIYLPYTHMTSSTLIREKLLVY